MKKFLILMVAIVATACTAPTTTTNRDDTNRNGSGATGVSAPLTEADAIAKERQIWETFDKQDYNAFANMMDEQAIYVTADGVYDKIATIKSVNGFMPKDVVFSDWKFLAIDKDLAVVTYKINYTGTANGQTIPPQSMYASTAWINRNGKWLAIYHQDTDVLKGPPPPPLATKTATPSPAPAGTPGTTSSNVEANEKMVWDALRVKNYEAFASFLAPEQIEVEPNAVNDKAASVKGVQAIDFSKTELSEWKTVKFDDDAAMVTYTARFPGMKPERERHTTIWANRGGKWMAMLHQGTPSIPIPPPAPAASK